MIPAYNEERTLPWVLAGVRKRLPGARILVVSDGSTDGTVGAARERGAGVLELSRRGYGEAVRAGFEEARRLGPDWLLQLDADGQHDPESLPGILGALQGRPGVDHEPRTKNHERVFRPDIVIGSRFLHPRSYRPALPRRLGMGFFAWLASRLTGLSITDPTSGMRGFSGKAVLHFAGDPRHSAYHDADVLVRAHKAGLRILEVPAMMREAPEGRSMHKGFGILLYAFRMLWATLRAAV